VIGFERNFTSVSEDIGNTTLRVAVLSGVLGRTVVVTFNTRNGTAEGEIMHVMHILVCVCVDQGSSAKTDIL